MSSKKCEECGSILKNGTYCLNCDTDKNVMKLYNLSYYTSIIATFIGVILLLASLINFGNGNQALGATLIISAIITAVISILLPLFMDWQALLLDNIHELNNKSKK